MQSADWLGMTAHAVIIVIFLLLWAQIRGLRIAIEVLTALIAAMNNKPRHD